MATKKLSEIAAKYNFDYDDFEKFVEDNYHSSTKRRLLGNKMITEIFDSKVDECVNAYKSSLPEIMEKNEKAREEAIKQANALDERKKAVSKILITSGFSFDGYTITKYSGYISGDDAVQVDRGLNIFAGIGTANVCDGLMSSLVKIRRKALQELKEAAYDLGCNAVIGVDFDYITLDPQTASITGGTTYMPYVFGVTANGNAVIIEKNEA